MTGESADPLPKRRRPPLEEAAPQVLVVNVSVDGVMYGPSYGNADRVPAEIAKRLTGPVWGDEVPLASAAVADDPPGLVVFDDRMSSLIRCEPGRW